MQLFNHFSVAHLVGHPAFEHLRVAMSAYDKARENQWLNVEQHDWTDCLIIGGSLSMLRKGELKHAVQAIILFQAMMEKVPYFVPDLENGLAPTTKSGFANSWDDLLGQIKNPSTQANAQAEFDAYKTDFYNAFRNPIVHTKAESDIAKVNDIRVPGVYEGMRRGWRAYDYLLTEAFAPEQVHEESWAQMCKTHDIPEELDRAKFPDLSNMEGQFIKRHLEGANAALEVQRGK